MEYTKRNFKFDNIKCILIFCVVFGHMIQNMDLNRFYRIIYLFHMPIFLFITGYFASFKPEKVIRNLVLPYVFFQMIYTVFQGILTGEKITIQFTTPYWILWYLLVVIYFYLLIPFLGQEEKWQQLLVLTGCIFIALISGYDQTIGYYMSLSRGCTFLPWFVAGYYAKKGLFTGIEKYKIPGFIAAALIVLASVLYFGQRVLAFDRRILQGSYGYEEIGYTPLIKAIWMLIAASFLVCFYIGVPNKKIPVISMIGQNTLSVFLLHGFCVKLIEVYGNWTFSNHIMFLLALFCSAGIVYILGNPYVSKLVSLGKIKKRKAL